MNYPGPDNQPDRVSFSAYQLALHSVLVFFSILAVYFITSPRELGLEDDGFFAMTAYGFGISHPPGFPLYSFFGKLATLVPVGTVAFRVHLLSAFFGALTCVVLWHCVLCIIKDIRYAYLASLCFGFSPVFWSQSIIAEVYTLNTAIFFTIFLLALIYREVDDNRQSDITTCHKAIVLLAGFLFGLGLSNHWPLMIVYSVTFVVILFPHIRSLIHLLKHFILASLVGLMPYVWMYFRSQHEIPFDIVGLFPFEDFSDLKSYVMRDIYKDYDVSETATSYDKLRYVVSHFQQFWAQYTYITIPLIIFGFKKLYNSDRQLAMALLVGGLLPELAILFKQDFDFDAVFESVLSVFPLITYGFLAIFLVLGLQVFVQYCRENNYIRSGITNMVEPLLVLSFVVFILFFNYGENNRRGYNWAKNYVEGVFSQLPHGAVVIVAQDVDMATLGYYRYVEKYRDDLLVVSTGNAFRNNFFDRKNSLEENIRHFYELLKDRSRPVYLLRAAANELLPDEYHNQVYGLLYQVALSDDGFLTRVEVYNTELLALLNTQLSAVSHNMWTIDAQNDLSMRAGYLLACYNGKNNSGQAEEHIKTVRVLESRLINSAYGLLGFSQGYMFCGGSRDMALSYLQQASHLLNNKMRKDFRAKIYLHIAQLKLSQNVADPEALYYMQLSVDTYPSPSNIAVHQLARLYAMLNMTELLEQHQQRFSVGK